MNDEMAQVLIVDDNVALARSLAEGLAEMGLVCQVVTNSIDALDAVREWRPAAAVIDIRMPGMDGMELLRQIRVTAPELVAVMLTALDDRGLAVQAMKLGALDYLVKPIRLKELTTSLYGALEKGREAGWREYHPADLHCETASRLDFTVIQCANGHDSVHMVYVRHNLNEVVWECPTCHRVVTMSTARLLPGQTRIYEGDMERERIRALPATPDESKREWPRGLRLVRLVLEEAPKHGLTSREVMSDEGAWLKVALSLAGQGKYPAEILKGELIRHRLRSVAGGKYDPRVRFAAADDSVTGREKLLVIASCLLELNRVLRRRETYYGLECPHCAGYGLAYLGQYSTGSSMNEYFRCISCADLSFRSGGSGKSVPGAPLHKI